MKGYDGRQGHVVSELLLIGCVETLTFMGCMGVSDTCIMVITTVYVAYYITKLRIIVCSSNSNWSIATNL